MRDLDNKEETSREVGGDQGVLQGEGRKAVSVPAAAPASSVGAPTLEH